MSDDQEPDAEFDHLLDQSSLGTPVARAYQALTPERVHKRLRTRLRGLATSAGEAAVPDTGEVALERPRQTEEDGADVSYDQDKAAYVRSQFERLGTSERYRVKITGDEGETHWMGVSPAVLAELRAVMTRVGDAPAVDG